MSNEQSILIIRNHVCKFNALKIKDLSKAEFYQNSCRKWAGEELLRYIEKHKYLSVIDAVEVFAKRMGSYACANSYGSSMFSIARDEAMYIYDILL